MPLAKTVTSNVKRVMTAPAEPTYGHKQVISAYRLKWIDLEEFLKQRFPEDKYPGVKFEEKKVNWQFGDARESMGLTVCHSVVVS